MRRLRGEVAGLGVISTEFVRDVLKKRPAELVRVATGRGFVGQTTGM